jgi:hypothetical protein
MTVPVRALVTSLLVSPGSCGQPEGTIIGRWQEQLNIYLSNGILRELKGALHVKPVNTG